MPLDTRGRSRRLFAGRDRALARSYLKGIGYTEEDLGPPGVGIANTDGAALILPAKPRTVESRGVPANG
jgi:dihydroxyacid dehydratase/phosphogluconate dehydratase